MCGILGAFGVDFDVQKLNKGLESLHHRGPNYESRQIIRHNEFNLYLGHRRLSILDLSDKAAQPMTRGHLTIIFNGEIFNYQELKIELAGLGHHFSTGSDTEVLLEAWLQWGKSCLERLNGMWAFAIWDDKEASLVLVRDRFGIKPLYYTKSDGTIYFSSEVQVLEHVMDCTPNATVLSTIATGKFDWHGTQDTFFEKVKSVPGGSLIHFLSPTNSYDEKWYQLKKREIPLKFEDQVANLRTLIFEATRIRMRSDVPIATCLSGGVDSTSLSATLYHLEREGTFSNFSHEAFTASFPLSAIDESTLARKFAETIGLKFNLVEMEAPSPDKLESFMAKCDGPMHSLAFYPIALLYQQIGDRGIKVTLDGQGPDEMLGGYHPIKAALRSAIRSGSIHRMRQILQIYGDQKGLERADLSRWKRSNLTTIGWDELKNPIRRLFHKTIPSTNGFHPFSSDPLDEDLYQQFFFSPLPAILQQYDRCSMAAGVECRMPFMDYRIVEFIFSLPVEAKVGNGYTKNILRHAMDGISPGHILWNKHKIGFNAPIVDWFHGPLREWMSDQMNSTSFLRSIYFDGSGIRSDFEDFLKSNNQNWDRAWKFWGPIHVNWWLNRPEK